MNWHPQRGKAGTLDVTANQRDHEKLRALIDQATGDSVDESDEHAGFLSVIREEVVCPFHARVAGEDVDCIRFEWPKNGYGLNAVCKSKDKTHVVDIGTLNGSSRVPRDTNGSTLTSPGETCSADRPQLRRSFQARRTAGG